MPFIGGKGGMSDRRKKEVFRKPPYNVFRLQERVMGRESVKSQHQTPEEEIYILRGK